MSTALAPSYRFYDKNLSTVQRNAKKLNEHPVFKNLEHIQLQINSLKTGHRRFIFAILAEKYGENSARQLAQDASIKTLVDNFEDLDKRTLEALDGKSQKINKNDISSSLRHSFYYKEKKPKTIKDEITKALTEVMPDILTPPKA